MLYLLTHSFQVHDLSHSVQSPNLFKAEYRRGGSGAVFVKPIRFQVEIIVHNGTADISKENPVHVVQFSLLSGECYHDQLINKES